MIEISPEVDGKFLKRIRVDEGSGCWEWTAGLAGRGYGYFYAGPDRGYVYAHRYAYETRVAPIPTGLVIDHLCRNRKCANPNHLEPVTNLENHRRGAWAMRTHCIHGHPFDEKNTYYTKRRHRKCRKCGALSQQKTKQRRALAA